jgi:tRNA(Ile)-lysidine synthase
MFSGETELHAAVSGGADSMCMLDIMLGLVPELTVLHFNHKLRGAASDADERFVRDYCEDRGVPLIVGYPEVPLEHNENAARAARYTFFAKYAKTAATAHTADDNVETVLMRLTRGSGGKGLGGINPVSRHGALRIVRPIICLTRTEVLEYLEYNSIPHIEDESNSDTRFTRNRVRAELIPVLREINPKLSEHALALSEDLRRDEDYLAQQARAFLEAAGFSADKASFGRYAFRTLHPAISSRALIIAAESLGVSLYREHIEAALKLTGANKGGWVLEFPRGVRLVCKNNILEFTIS